MNEEGLSYGNIRMLRFVPDSQVISKHNSRSQSTSDFNPKETVRTLQ